MARRYCLRPAEQRVLAQAIQDAHRQAEPHLAELRRIGDETVAAALPPEARDEAWRAWINLIIRAMVGSRL
jgi:hypothetical protein